MFNVLGVLVSSFILSFQNYNFLLGELDSETKTVIKVIVILAVVFFLFGTLDRMRYLSKHSKCRKCKTKYEPKNITVYMGELKWQRQSKTETDGDWEIRTSYKKFYYDAQVVCHCDECGAEQVFRRRIDVYSGDSEYSPDTDVILGKILQNIRQAFPRNFFGDERINLIWPDDD